MPAGIYPADMPWLRVVEEGTVLDTEERKAVMIVDDMELNRKILAMTLEEKYDIVEVENGLQAKSVLKSKKRKISLILLDIVMPIMDGFSFLREIQTNPRYNCIPVIFVTSEAYEENVLEAYKMGVQDVIAKPFDPYVVSKRVDNLIRLTEGREAARLAKAGYVSLPHTALIVGGVNINRVIIRTALESGYDILEACDGRKALALLEERHHEIAVVLLDIIKSAMDGITMMREARKRKLVDGIPVIAITTEDSPWKLQTMKNLGICEIIQKPFTISVVRNRVDNVVELARAYFVQRM